MNDSDQTGLKLTHTDTHLLRAEIQTKITTILLASTVFLHDDHLSELFSLLFQHKGFDANNSQFHFQVSVISFLSVPDVWFLSFLLESQRLWQATVFKEKPGDRVHFLFQTLDGISL